MQICFLSDTPCTSQEAVTWITSFVVFLGTLITVSTNYLVWTRSTTRIDNANLLANDKHQKDIAILEKEQQWEKDLKLYEANLDAIKRNQSVVVERLRKFQASAELAETRARPLSALQTTLAAVKDPQQKEEIAYSILTAAGELLAAAGGVFALPGSDEPHLPSHCVSSLRKLRLAVIRVLLLLNYEAQTGQDPQTVHTQMNAAMTALHKAVIAFSQMVEIEQSRVITKAQVESKSAATPETQSASPPPSAA